ncbi:copper resistance CopC/CopD family protein [Streptomyces anulatus]|uniref:copper resistance CopC/CopD family protein n=1 Tax=Streptomyces anulatus TaxID=1892 RepID=UPI0033343249
MTTRARFEGSACPAASGAASGTRPGSARVRRAVGGLIALLMTLPVLLGGAGQAAAHGALVSTDPAENAVLPAQPSAVTLTFGEGVTLPDGSLRVFDPVGGRVDVGAPRHTDGTSDSVRVALRDGLGDGTYTVAWQVVSADSHPIGGAFTFSVGAPSASAVSADDLQGARTDGVIAFLYGTGQAIGYGAFALLVGAVAFLLVCWPAGASVLRVRQLLAAGWAGLLASTVVLMMLRGPYEQGSGILPSAEPGTAAVHVDVDERIYVALAVRMLLLVGGAVYLVFLIGQLSRPAAGGTRPASARLGAIGLLLAVGIAATWVTTNHASEGIQVWISMPVTVLHILAMAVWLGGLATLVAGLRNRIGPASVDRFSRMALASVTVLAATGVYRSWRDVGSWDALFGTGYGQLLLIKVGCVALMLAAAAVSRSRLARFRRASVAEPLADTREDPSVRKRLSRSVLAESSVAVVVLVVTTLLTSSSPGRTGQAQAAVPRTPASASTDPAVSSRIPFDTGGRARNASGTAVVGLTPVPDGGYDVTLRMRAADGKPVDVPEVRLAFALPARDLGPLRVPLRKGGADRWSGTVLLALAGDWTVSLTVRSSEIDQTTAVGKLTIGD